MRSHLLFLLGFLKNPRTVSSIVPTSSYGAKRVCDLITKPGRKVLVELGPGTGIVSKAVLACGKLTPDSLLILIEKTEFFAKELQAMLGSDSRVRVFHDSAENLDQILAACGEKKVDYALCSVPLSLLEKDVRRSILKKTFDALKDEGSLIVYLFRYRIKSYLKEIFPRVSLWIVWRNIPPLFLYEAKKR